MGSNPLVHDRINEVCALLNNAKDERRARIHPRCVRLHESLQKQQYVSGTTDPDKDGGWDHMNDAYGYLVHYLFPIRRQKSKEVAY
jgi:hypothetical protein